MKASDVMVSPVFTVKPDSSVKDLANLLVEKRISAVPVVDDAGKLVGVVSEGDLMHRSESGTERRRSWWLRLIAGDAVLATDYAKAHARKVADIMSRDVITAEPDTPLDQVAALMERNKIKRVPIMQNGQIVGIVSRANLVQAIANAPGAEVAGTVPDAAIRDRLLKHLKAQPWAHTDLLNVDVKDGVVTLTGMANSEAERKAIRVAAEAMPGVRKVEDEMVLRPADME